MKRTQFLLIALTSVFSTCTIASKTDAEANKALVAATLQYGLTNVRTVKNQEAFDQALKGARNLNLPVVSDPLYLLDTPDSFDTETLTPIAAAAYSLSYYMILKLIMAGADPQAKSPNGFNAYDWVRDRSWISAWFPKFQQCLDAALSLRPSTSDQKEFIATLTEVYRLLEPVLKQRWRGFYKEPQHAGIVEFIRNYHESYMNKAAALLMQTQKKNADYRILAAAAQRLLQSVQTLPEVADRVK